MDNREVLPRDVRPVHYQLIVEPHFESRVLHCLVHISLQLTAASIGSHSIVLNAKKLRFHNAMLRVPLSDNGSCTIEATNFDIDEQLERVTIEFAEAIPSTAIIATTATAPLAEHEPQPHAVLSVLYTATVSHENRGLYVHSPSKESTPQYNVCTHFEPCDARCTYPCFDEPALKATFQVEAFLPPEVAMVSNMPVASETTIGPEASSTAPLISRQISEWIAHYQALIASPNRLGSYYKYKYSAVPSTATNTKASIVHKVFHRTPIMSTYLLTLVFMAKDNYRCLQDTVQLDDSCSVNLAIHYPKASAVVWGPTAADPQPAAFAMQVLQRAIREFYRIFGCPFMILPENQSLSLSIVAVDTLDALAMENYGAMVFLKEYLLVDERTPLARRQRITRLICHEVSHQWFGNLVSIEWWSYLWLKEGVARYLEYTLVDAFYPEWRYWSHFVSEIYSDAIDMDEAPHRTHPVEGCVQYSKTSTVMQIFDFISYGKGASVVRMIAGFVGSEVLRAGLRLFLQRFQCRSATTEDLWRALSDAIAQTSGGLIGDITLCSSVSGQRVVTAVDIEELTSKWIKEQGHPIITISELPDDGSGRKLRLQQHGISITDDSDSFTELSRSNALPQFILQRLTTNATQTSTSFKVPILVRYSSDAVLHYVLDGTEATLTVPNSHEFAADNAWVKFNYGHTGFYRTNYSPAMWRSLIGALRRGQLPELDRIGILIDAFAVFWYDPVHAMPVTLLFDIIDSFRYDCDSEYVWAFLTKKLLAAVHRLQPEDDHVVATAASILMSQCAASSDDAQKEDAKAAIRREELSQLSAALSVPRQWFAALTARIRNVYSEVSQKLFRDSNSQLRHCWSESVIGDILVLLALCSDPNAGSFASSELETLYQEVGDGSAIDTAAASASYITAVLRVCMIHNPSHYSPLIQSIFATSIAARDSDMARACIDALLADRRSTAETSAVVHNVVKTVCENWRAQAAAFIIAPSLTANPTARKLVCSLVCKANQVPRGTFEELLAIVAESDFASVAFGLWLTDVSKQATNNSPTATAQHIDTGDVESAALQCITRGVWTARAVSIAIQ